MITPNGTPETYPYLIGEHSLIQKITQLVKKVATTDATILIMGESGTGKELVARAIHAYSARVDRPFIPVNCGAIPAELLESEMFGRAAPHGRGRPARRHVPTREWRHDLPDEVREMAPPQVKLSACCSS